MDVDGYAAAHGMPELSELSLRRFCSFIWYMLTRNADDNERARIESRLWQPPPTITTIPARSPWSAESETQLLAAAKATLAAQ